MKQKASAILFIAVIAISAGCAGTIPSQVVDLQATIPQPTTAAVTMTEVMTSTPTATNTWIPSSTPTIGPPPDLELKNVIIYPEHGDFEQAGQKYNLFGRVRNNTAIDHSNQR